MTIVAKLAVQSRTQLVTSATDASRVQNHSKQHTLVHDLAIFSSLALMPTTQWAVKLLAPSERSLIDDKRS